MQETIVNAKDVSMIYHDISGETIAVDHLSFHVNKGEFVAIVGPSGCGKTTVLSMLAGIIQASGGALSIHCNRTGYMLQRDHLLDWRTVEGNILLGLQVKRMLSDETYKGALDLLKKYGLYEFKDRYPRQLSGGMRQKVALIRTLAFSPELLLLDEPFSSLDYQTRLMLSDEIYEIIKTENKTVVLVTHDIAEAISMSDRILVFTKRPARVKSEYRIQFAKEGTPLKKRNMPEFKDYFDMIWRDIDNAQKS